MYRHSRLAAMSERDGANAYPVNEAGAKAGMEWIRRRCFVWGLTSTWMGNRRLVLMCVGVDCFGLDGLA